MVGVAPPPEHRVRCQPPLTLSGGDERLIFEIDGHKKGVSLKINKLSRRLVEALPDRALDLIEIAALVYAVDASISRGESTDQQMGAKWHRLFVIEMPVFDLDIWTTPKIKDALEETLMFLSGDSLQNHTLRAPLAGIRIRPRRAEDGLTVPLQLQMLPAEMLPLDMNRTLPGAGLIRQGIEFDGIGRRVAYHFLRRHPGDLTDPGLSGETVRVPATDVIHVLDPVEAGQLRGVSRFAAAIVKLFTLDLYDDAELERKKIAAMFAMFITSPAPETPLEPTEDDLEVEPGQVVRLDPGEDVSTPATPDSGGTYEPFQYRTLLQIAAALGVPYGYLTGDTAKGNFSNTRISLIEFRRRISAWQHGVLVYQLCRAVWVRWMDTAVLSGALDLPGYDSQRRQYQACAWLPTKWDWIDPMKDASAEILQIEAGLKSRTQALAERGYDAEQVDREIAAERKREAALGLDFRRPGSPAQGPGAVTGNDDDSDGEDQRANNDEQDAGDESAKPDTKEGE